VETLIATAEHDDVNDELNLPDLIHENGGPRNFKMKDFEAGRCQQLLELGLTKGRYIGILMAKHIQFLYGDEASARQYCEKLKKKTRQWILEAGTTDREISASYALLEFCDAFSLLICQGLVQPENRKMEISNGPDGTGYQLSLAENGNLIVSPWPFEEDTFKINYESRCLTQLSFKNDAEFKQKLNQAPVTLNVVVVSRK
jgi:hypothetical protein